MGPPVWCIRSTTDSWHGGQVHWQSTDAANSWKVRGLAEVSCRWKPSFKRLHYMWKNHENVDQSVRRVEPMGPSTRQFIQLGFGFMISNPEVRGPSGLSTTRPQAGENNGLKRSFSGGTPKHVISPLNIAKKIWMIWPPHLRRHNNLSHQSYWTKRWLNTFDCFLGYESTLAQAI